MCRLASTRSTYVSYIATEYRRGENVHSGNIRHKFIIRVQVVYSYYTRLWLDYVHFTLVKLANQCPFAPLILLAFNRADRKFAALIGKSSPALRWPQFRRCDCRMDRDHAISPFDFVKIFWNVI